jgi:hypothetical protein
VASWSSRDPVDDPQIRNLAATPGGLPIECVQSDGIAAPDCHGSFIDP